MRLALLVLCLALPAGAAWARVDIAVDLSRQLMRVEAAEGSYLWPVSSGRFGHATPRGSYRIGRLEPMHRSRRYNNAPMPHAMFFSGGYAIHGTTDEAALGTPASHGCIRLSRGDAAALYAMVRREGGRVTVTGVSPPDAGRMAVRQSSGRRDPGPFWADDDVYGPEVVERLPHWRGGARPPLWPDEEDDGF